MRLFLRIAVSVLCVISAGTSRSVRADEIRDTTLNFRLIIPDGFQPLPDVLKANPELVYAFGKPDDAGGMGMFIFIEKMKGVVGARSGGSGEA